MLPQFYDSSGLSCPRSMAPRSVLPQFSGPQGLFSPTPTLTLTLVMVMVVRNMYSGEHWDDLKRTTGQELGRDGEVMGLQRGHLECKNDFIAA